MKLKNLILPVLASFLVVAGVSADSYVIQPGDTLSGIAKLFGTTYQKIADDNGIANPNLIYAGDSIEVGVGGMLGSAPMRPSGIDIAIRQSLVAGASRTGNTLNIDPIVTADGHRWTMAEIGSIAFGKIDQGTSNEEIISWTSSTDYTTYYQLGNVSWGYDYTGLTTSTSNYKRHNSGARFIITDDDHWLNSQYMNLGYSQTVTGAKVFTTFPSFSPVTTLPTTNGQFATKYYVDTVGAGGFTSVNVSTTRGLSVDGSSPEKVGINASSTTGMAFDDDGKLYQKATTGLISSFSGIGIDYANNNTWTGTNTFNGTTTLATTTVTGIDLAPLINGTSTALHYHDSNVGQFSSSSMTGGSVGNKFTITHGLASRPKKIRATMSVLGTVTDVFSGISTGYWTNDQSITSTSTQYSTFFGIDNNATGSGDAEPTIGVGNNLVRVNLSTVLVSLDLWDVNDTTFVLNVGEISGSSIEINIVWEAEL